MLATQKVAAAIFITRLSMSHNNTMQALESTDLCQQMVLLYHTHTHTHNNVQHVYCSLESQRSVYVPTRFSYRLHSYMQSVCFLGLSQ